MQCSWHVDSFVVAIRTLESHVFGIRVGPDMAEEVAERNGTPLADIAPAFYADRAHALYCRQRVKMSAL
jgi:hypothetical protein